MKVREMFALFGLETKKEDFDKVNQSLEGIKNTAHAVLGVYIGEKLIQGLIGGFRSFGETSREIMDAQLLGINTTTYQVLQQSAEMFGIQRQRFNVGIAMMQREAYSSVYEGNKSAGMTFARLGVDVMGANGHLKDAKTLLFEVADGIKRISDPNIRGALAERLFGMRDFEFQQLLIHGSEGIQGMIDKAQALGLTMGPDMVKAGMQFHESMSLVHMVVEGLKNKLMGELAPIINNLVGKLLDWVKAHKKLVDQNIHEFAQGLVKVSLTLFHITMDLIGAFKGLSVPVGGITNAIQILIYTWLAFKALTVVQFIWGLATAFWGLVPAIMAGAQAIGSLMVAAAPLVGLILLVTALYLMLKDVIGFFEGKKSVTGMVVAGTKSIFGNLGTDMAGKGHLTEYARTRAAEMAYGQTNNNVVLHQHNEINVHETQNAKATATAVGSAIQHHTDAMLKDGHRKLSPGLAY